VLEGVFFLIGQTGDREALPIVRRFLPVVESLDTALVQRLLGCIAALAGPEDTALIPWLLEKATASDYSRIALRGLYRIHRPTAAAALPAVAGSLSGMGPDAPVLLARTLALLMPPLSQHEQREFFNQVGSALRLVHSPELTRGLLEALEQTPGISPQALGAARLWEFKAVSAVPRLIATETSEGAESEEGNRLDEKARRTAVQKKEIADRRVIRVERLVERLRRERLHPGPTIQQIDQQIAYLDSWQRRRPEGAGLYAEASVRLRNYFLDAGLAERAESYLQEAREAAPGDPYAASLQIQIDARGGNLAKAEETFLRAVATRSANAATYNAMLRAYGESGNVAKAEEVFAGAKELGLVNELSCGALLRVYGKAGDLAKAEAVFAEAKDSGLLNQETYIALLDVYAKAGNLAEAEKVIAEAKEAGFLAAITPNELLGAYGKAGGLAKAKAVPAEAKTPNLLLAIAPLVKRVAFEMRQHLPPHVEVGDLVGPGTLGLAESLRRFDPSWKVKLGSYARHRIRGGVLDALRTLDPAGRDVQRRAREVERTYRELEARLSRPVQGEEVARALGLSLKLRHRWAQEVHALGFDAWQYSGMGVSPGKVPVGEESRMPVRRLTEDPFDLCYRREQRDLLNRALARLPERERLIVTLYHQQDLTMKEIAARLGVDELRVSELHAEALQRLKQCVQASLRAGG